MSQVESPEKQAESFPCDECGKTFASKKLISAHKKRHDVKRAAAAAAATEAAIDASPDDPNAKRDTPLNKLKWRCSFFPKNFEVKQSSAGRTVGRPVTRNSKNRQHTGRQLHRCKVCSKCLATSESLAKHMAAHLANPDEPQTCDECGKTFASLKLLKVHKKRHDAKRVSEAAGDPSVPPAADDRKWQCSFCPKKFKYKHPLMVHERTHTGEKPLACRFCDKRFRQQTPLTMHERWHTNDRRHECEICKKRFLQQAALRIHFRTHSGERPYQCKICPKTFARDTTFRKHQMVHLRNKVSNILNGQGLPAGTSDNTQSSSLNDEDSTLASIQKQDDSMEDLVKSGHICPNCGKIFAYLSALNDHMRAHAEKSFECMLCGKKFGYKHTLNSHLRTHTGTKKYKCKYCDETFVHHNTKNAHQVTKHINPAAYACPMCPSVLSSASALATHKQTHGERRFQCPHCPKRFTLQSYVRFHIAKVHADDETQRYQCKECGKNFAFAAFLAIHMRTHSGEKPFKCRFCSKCFSSYGSMRNHERVHLGIRPFTCKMCGKAFVYRSQLAHHEFAHSGKKPTLVKYVCKHCNKKFDYHCHLRAHLLHHTGERPFKCQFCDKRYSSKNNLQVHERLHTNERPFKCTGCNKSYAKNEYLKTHLKRCEKYDEAEQCSSDAEASLSSSMEAFVYGDNSYSTSSEIENSMINDTIEANPQEHNVSTSASETIANESLSLANDSTCGSILITGTNDNKDQQHQERIRARKRKPMKKSGHVLSVSGIDDTAANRSILDLNLDTDGPQKDLSISSTSQPIPSHEIEEN